MAPRARLVVAGAIPFLLLLGWLSLSSSVAAFLALPHDAIVASAASQQPVTVKEALSAAAANERAAAWFDGGRYRLQAARVLLALPSARRAAEVRRIERLTRAALVEAPMSPYGWTLLTFLRMDAQDIAGATRAWDMSVLTGRYVPDLMQSRILLGIELMEFSPAVRESVIDQIRVLAAADPASLAQLARAGGQEPLVRAILTDADQSAAFERQTRSLRGGARHRIDSAANGQAR